MYSNFSITGKDGLCAGDRKGCKFSNTQNQTTGYDVFYEY